MKTGGWLVKCLIVGLLLLAGCRGVDTHDGRNDGMGELSLRIADGPIDEADSVFITITAVQAMPMEEATPVDIPLEEPLSIDLLDFADGSTERVLDEELLDIGQYQSLTIVLDETQSLIEIQGSQYEVPVRDGAESNLTIPVNFEMEDDSEFDFTIDFDLRQSIVQTGEGPPPTFEMIPHLRLVDTDRVAVVMGSVARHLITDPDCENNTSDTRGNAIYAFSGLSSPVQDIRGTQTDPIATATVNRDGEYILANLAPGSYTLAFTCDAAIDVLDQDNLLSMEFTDSEDVTLGSGDVETVDFD